MKVLKITWLNSCEKCGFDNYLNVHTERGVGCYLWSGDAVYCPKCDNKGFIECDSGCSYVQWDINDS